MLSPSSFHFQTFPPSHRLHAAHPCMLSPCFPLSGFSLCCTIRRNMRDYAKSILALEMIVRDVQKRRHPLAYSQPDFTKQSPEMWAAKLKQRIIFPTASHVSNKPETSSKRRSKLLWNPVCNRYTQSGFIRTRFWGCEMELICCGAL